MAFEDFEGRYQVKLTSGTQFGIGTEVEIKADPAAGVGGVEVVFHPPGQHPVREAGTYDAARECLQLSLEAPERVMLISRFYDPRFDYRGLFSIVVVDEAAPGGPAFRFCTWSAARPSVEPGAVRQEAAERRAGEATAGRSYVITSTANTQFGFLSRLTVGAEGVRPLGIVDAAGASVSPMPALEHDPDTHCLWGSIDLPAFGSDGEGEPLTVWVREGVVELDGELLSLLYGLSYVGDPDQAGTFGGQEESGGTGAFRGGRKKIRIG